MRNQILSEYHFESSLLCPAGTRELKPKNNFGEQSNYGNKTPCLSMSTVHRTCNSFPWHSSEYSLQTPSISMDQNPHRRTMGERALTFSQHVSSVMAAWQGNWERTHGADTRGVLIPGKKHSSVLIQCSPATAQQSTSLTMMPTCTHSVYFSKGRNQGETHHLLKSAGALTLT